MERVQRLGNKAQQLLAGAGREPQPVEVKVLVPLVNGAALEPDESLADKWAALLANAADPAQRVNVEAGYVEILKQLTPTDAQLLKALYSRSAAPSYSSFTKSIDYKILRLSAGIGANFDLSLDNLVRMRLCALSAANEPNSPFARQSFDVTTTVLGYHFYKACSPPTT